MCGILGVWHQDGRPVDLAALRSGLKRIRHRGPDDEGYLLANTKTGRAVQCGGADTDPRLSLPRIEEFLGERFDLVLAHRRLSIIDLSPAGHQPMASSDDAYWIIHNGEVYNYPELRMELEGLGHVFRTSTDTEVILAAHQQWGDECVRRFNGMWAFAIWDSNQRRLLCSRDHFGIKPLYYWQGRDTFAFASEIKALLAYPGIQTQPNWPVVGDFLVHGLVDHTRETFFANIWELPPAHLLVKTSHEEGCQQYWDIKPNASRNGYVGADEVQYFYELLRDSVRIRLRSDVPVGTCLSGGLDSTSVAVLISELQQDSAGSMIPRSVPSQKTYSACYNDLRYDERRYIELVVAATGAKATYTYPDAGGLVKDLESLAWHQEMPFQSTSMYAQYCVMRAARQDGTIVLLDGQGSDEILAGYHSYVGAFSAALLRSGQWTRWVREMQVYPANPPLSMAATMRASLGHLLPTPVLKLWRRLPARSLPDFVNPDLARLARSDREMPYVNVGDPLSTALYVSVFRRGLQALLRYEDRNSMAFSIESRLPFLDPRLVEYAFSLPLEAKIQDGWTKAILRKAMEGRLPDAVRLRRDKMGFPTPEDTWLGYDNGKLLERVFDKDLIRRHGILNWSGIRKRISMLGQKSSVRQQRELWRCVSVELWLRMFADKKAEGL